MDGPHSWEGPLGRVPPTMLVLAGCVSVQIGAGLAGRLFTQLPAAAVTGLRLWAGALIIAAVGGRGLARTVRELVANRSWQDAGIAVAFGLTLALMNFSIYQAFARIPLGIAVTIEFLGPLAVAVVTSRRPLDLLWVALAGAGVLLLVRGGTSLAHGARASGAGGAGGAGLVVTGTLFALTAAACWALYIVLSRSTGRRFSGSSGLVLAMILAAVVVTPPAVAAGHAAAAGSAGHGGADRLAVLGHPVRIRAAGAAPDTGPGVRHLDEPGAGHRRGGRAGPAERVARGPRMGRDRLRDRGQRGRGPGHAARRPATAGLTTAPAGAPGYGRD
jgi:threonine/homoserine efflux transporter RhtA